MMPSNWVCIYCFALPLIALQVGDVCGEIFPDQAQVAVFGHKSPDTDAISAALVYTWELNSRNISAAAYRLGDLNPETEFVLQTLGVTKPPLLPTLFPGKRVAIVDTNNPSELPAGIEKATIHSIVDHHKLSGLATPEPLEVDIRPLCSTGSILFARSKMFGLTPPKTIAALMLSSILSDSLGFRSPTTTAIDKVYANELADLTGIDALPYAEAMLDAKANIGHLSARELLHLDSKIYEIHGHKLRVSVLELTRPENALRKKTELVISSRNLVAEEELDDVLLFVIDILNQSAHFISTSESAGRLVEDSWNVVLQNNGSVVLPGVLSRKKQIIPKLTSALRQEEL